MMYEDSSRYAVQAGATAGSVAALSWGIHIAGPDHLLMGFLLGIAIALVSAALFLGLLWFFKIK